MLPFFVCGALLFLLMIPIACLLKNDLGANVNQTTEDDSEQTAKELPLLSKREDAVNGLAKIESEG